ncbi:MAG TPA: phage holin family protein [Candidatus Krumholzibacteria bacterium]|nr:phage holin family protein [Candidatus Krumholzibacteria bacterium]HRX51321.1 phage holin family protein [Candidatus Krumholzibacteria bacterium]
MELFIVQTIVIGLLLYVVAKLTPGMEVDGVGQALLAGLVLGIVNALVRPVLVILTLPITVLTLGVFLLAINALMLRLVGALVPGFHVKGCLPALVGALLLSVLSFGATLIM